MPNIITDSSSTAINVVSYQKPLIKKFTNVIKYGLNGDNNKANKELFNTIMHVEMYDWLNTNNCCSIHIQCNFTHIQKTLQFLKNLNLNINTKSCC
mgnify:CR=1 FL=1|jgi:hypothetical protein